jgi:hypothetical protein
MSQVERTLQRARSPAIAYLWPRRLKPALYSCDAAKAGVRFPAYGAGRRLAEYSGDARSAGAVDGYKQCKLRSSSTVLYFAVGDGRIWSFTTFGLVPLPPS